MGIKYLQMEFAGTASVHPRLGRMITTDNFTTITTPNYLNSETLSGQVIFDSDFIFIFYNTFTELGIFTASITAGIITLVPLVSNTSVRLPVQPNEVAAFYNTQGEIYSNETPGAAGYTIHGSLFLGGPTVNDLGQLYLYNGTGTDSGFFFIALNLSYTYNGNQSGLYFLPVAQNTYYYINDPGFQNASLVVGPLNWTRVGDIVTTSVAGCVQDSGVNIANVLTSSISNPDVALDMVGFDIAVTHTELATGASMPLYVSSGSKQYKIINLFINSGGTNFSGGGGDRLLSITDNTTVYSVVPATDLQTLVNAGWGSTPLPYPASAAINTSTTAGASLVAKYSGGTTDYTAGSITISGVMKRVA
jgi:hypothetical protein